MKEKKKQERHFDFSRSVKLPFYFRVFSLADISAIKHVADERESSLCVLFVQPCSHKSTLFSFRYDLQDLFPLRQLDLKRKSAQIITNDDVKSSTKSLLNHGNIEQLRVNELIKPTRVQNQLTANLK